MFGNVLTKQSYQNEFEIKQTASLQFFSMIMMTCTHSHCMCVTRANESFNDITNLFLIFSIHVFILISNEKELIEIRNYLKY